MSSAVANVDIPAGGSIGGGLFLTCSSVYAIWRGEARVFVTTFFRRNTKVIAIRRNERPIVYWIHVVGVLIAGLVLLGYGVSRLL